MEFKWANFVNVFGNSVSICLCLCTFIISRYYYSDFTSYVSLSTACHPYVTRLSPACQPHITSCCLHCFFCFTVVERGRLMNVETARCAGTILNETLSLAHWKWHPMILDLQTSITTFYLNRDHHRLTVGVVAWFMSLCLVFVKF